MSLRFALAAIYDALTRNLDDEQRDKLDEALGLYEDEPDYRLAPDVPTTQQDPAAMAALAMFGDAVSA